MMFSSSRASLKALPFAAGLVFAAGSVQAQGTDAQREACTPDAFRLCQSTIPDVDKTTACMKAHFAQLSPRCKVAFSDATGPSKSGAPRREAVSPPARRDEETDNTEVVVAPSLTPGLPSYEAQIRGYCRDGLIDPFTCRNTLAVLRGAE